MKTILSNQTVDIPEQGQSAPRAGGAGRAAPAARNACPPLVRSGSFAEGPDGHREGTPRNLEEGFQPHQRGAVPPGKEAQEGGCCAGPFAARRQAGAL